MEGLVVAQQTFFFARQRDGIPKNKPAEKWRFGSSPLMSTRPRRNRVSTKIGDCLRSEKRYVCVCVCVCVWVGPQRTTILKVWGRFRPGGREAKSSITCVSYRVSQLSVTALMHRISWNEVLSSLLHNIVVMSAAKWVSMRIILQKAMHVCSETGFQGLWMCTGLSMLAAQRVRTILRWQSMRVSTARRGSQTKSNTRPIWVLLFWNNWRTDEVKLVRRENLKKSEVSQKCISLICSMFELLRFWVSEDVWGQVGEKWKHCVLQCFKTTAWFEC